MNNLNTVTSISQHGKLRRLTIWGIPIDILPAELFQEVAQEFLQANGSHQIVFLRVRDFMRALRNPEYRACLQAAALVLPVSRALQTAARQLHLPAPQRYEPFDLIIRLMNILEQIGGSYYILGDDAVALGTVEKNLRQTFPLAQTLGRHSGGFNTAYKRNIITAIAKAAPNFLLAGPGLRGRDLWIYRSRLIYRRGVQLWSGESFDYFALRKRRPNRVSFSKGREYFQELIRHPWKIAYAPLYIMFQFAILAARLVR